MRARFRKHTIWCRNVLCQEGHVGLSRAGGPFKVARRAPSFIATRRRRVASAASCMVEEDMRRSQLKRMNTTDPRLPLYRCYLICQTQKGHFDDRAQARNAVSRGPSTADALMQRTTQHHKKSPGGGRVGLHPGPFQHQSAFPHAFPHSPATQARHSRIRTVPGHHLGPRSRIIGSGHTV
jgi:hypothetical protein